jgi:signal peptidase II
MTIKNKRYFIASLLIAAVTFVLDQASKYWLLYGIGFYEHQNMMITITGFFNLVMVWNYGISFGMFSGARVPLALIIMASAIILVLLNWLRKVIWYRLMFP